MIQMNGYDRKLFTPSRLSDSELGRLVRETLREPGVSRVEVYGRPERECIDAVRSQRKTIRSMDSTIDKTV